MTVQISEELGRYYYYYGSIKKRTENFELIYERTKTRKRFGDAGENEALQTEELTPPTLE